MARCQAIIIDVPKCSRFNDNVNYFNVPPTSMMDFKQVANVLGVTTANRASLGLSKVKSHHCS